MSMVKIGQSEVVEVLNYYYFLDMFRDEAQVCQIFI